MSERLAYTIREACEALRIGPTKLSQLLGDQKLKAVALGGKTLILRSEIERFLSDLPPVAVQARDTRSINHVDQK